MDNILMTSGYDFEGYSIKEYIQLCTGECVLGTGFLSGLGAGIADILGCSSGDYENKLAKARECAISELKNEAIAVGANGIIGIDIKYTTFSSDIIGVIASGTAVYVTQKNEYELMNNVENNVVSFPVVNYYGNLGFRIYKFNYDFNQNRVWLDMCVFKDYKVKAMNVNIILNTIFEKSYIYEDINITQIGNDNQTEKVEFVIPVNQLKAVKSVNVIVNCYVDDNQCIINKEEQKMVQYSVVFLNEQRILYGNDVVADYEKVEKSWKCICGKENDNVTKECSLCKRTYGMYNKIGYKLDLEQLLNRLNELDNTNEIYKYLTDECVINDTESSKDLLVEIEKMAKLERMYGNMKQDCIELIKKHY